MRDLTPSPTDNLICCEKKGHAQRIISHFVTRGTAFNFTAEEGYYYLRFPEYVNLEGLRRRLVNIEFTVE